MEGGGLRIRGLEVITRPAISAVNARATTARRRFRNVRTNVTLLSRRFLGVGGPGTSAHGCELCMSV